jgi:hypothetical protein
MKKLELIFENEDGKNVTYALDNPVDPADADMVKAAMDEVIAQDIFTSAGGAMVKVKSARIVERNVTDIELV